ncbi:GTPase ObgE [Ferrimicrobium acidiphilum]|jgi:GTP-binding protein|uniref:GTPase Obg n=1 Tax=Ferrimicrobium acidiphilum DSM 19497 TaxID=1121877 RepID=A0A0D8FXR1_9ACTN|nr:GTPase ObgE [Ferrimicrobium acidiphilum]KJE78063.1 GTPase Obg [Ferrimicrobium acidiphilum DSM 19497]MCL5053253.1 GTPase ObgE [Gammaproteobacteria bacterium]
MAEFVDAAQIHVKAGNGGAGAVSFRREAHVDRGGPDGGDGGKGGDVVLVVDPQLASLIVFRDQPFRRAGDGAHGQGKKMHGAGGRDQVVGVPLGTVVRDFDGTLIADLAETGSKIVIARGGRGGAGNARFLSNRRRAPGFGEQGEVGEEFWFNLELKLKADVCLIGEPNVGKSSLIANISRARPKIADYAFTTLVPNLGVVRPPDATEYIVADIPGLIEGASEGRGLGHAFLRHVERAVALALVVPADLEEVVMHERVNQLLHELTNYQESLGHRPRVLVGTRLDLVDDEEQARERMSRVAEDFSMPLVGVVSNLDRQGMSSVVYGFAKIVESARASAPATVEKMIYRPRPNFEVNVTRTGDASFVVEGRDALHAVGLSDLGQADALAIVHTRLERMGVFRMLRRLGCREGDSVRIGSFEFTFEED